MTLSELLKNSAERNPEKTAIVFGEKTYTYRALYQATLACAEGLRSEGIKEGDRVAILLKNCPEFVIAVFGLAHLGATATLINFLLKPEEVEYILKDIAASSMVTQTSLLDTVRSVQKACPALKNLWVAGLDAEEGAFKPFSSLLKKPPARELHWTDDEKTMLVLYTSGTTGNPKGAMLSHKNITTNAFASIEALEIKPNDRFLLILPMFHIFAWTTNVLVPIHVGANIVVVESIRPPGPWLKLMFKHRITCFTAVPQIYAVLAEQAKGLKKWVLRFLFFGRVRLCITGAAPLSKETIEKFEKNIGIPILEGYGLTETSPVTNCNRPRARKAGSVGPAVPGAKIKIVDENEAELPVGEEGEICISGPGVMQGYLNQPEATKAAFTKDGWFKTGDIGVLDGDGFLYIRDRIKDMIIVKGLKVFSAQVEQVLLSHPAVSEAAVVGIPHGTGDEIVKAFVVLKEGSIAEKSALLDFCKDKLAAYKRPKDIEIRKELPKNALQKVLKRQLRQESLKGAP